MFEEALRRHLVTVFLSDMSGSVPAVVREYLSFGERDSTARKKLSATLYGNLRHQTERIVSRCRIFQVGF